MSHVFDQLSQFCRVCAIPLRALHDFRDLDECSPENAAKWQAREKIRVDRIERETAAWRRSQAIDAELLPAGTTWGHIRRALGLDRWER